MNKLTLKLNQDSSIIISSYCDESNEHWNYLSKISLTFVKNNIKKVIGENVLDTMLIDLKFFFHQLSMNELQLDDRFNEFDIGLYFNIYSYNLRRSKRLKEILINSYLTFEKDLSEPYLLFGGNEFLVWVFNLDESQILKITPFYDGLNKSMKMAKDYKKFKDWIDLFKVFDEIELDQEFTNENISIIESVYNKVAFGK